MSFEKIIGYDEEKKELLQIREMLINAEEYRRSGLHIPRGIVLCGRPGTGKTVLAKAIAEGTSLVEIKASSCSDDDRAGMIEASFAAAKENAPCVLLIDEIDKIAGVSRHFYMEESEEVNRILLQEIDALKEDEAVLIVATCNNYRCLGNALVRPGRFDRVLEIELPPAGVRESILQYYIGKLSLVSEIDIPHFAKLTEGFTGADLECLVNETGILAMQKGDRTLSNALMNEALNHMVFHSSEREVRSELTERNTAVHEAGHAIVAMKLFPSGTFSASIIPQGSSLGHTRCIPENDEQTVKQTEKEITVLLAGRVAERIVNGDIGLGATCDLSRAADSLLDLVINHGAYGYRHLLAGMGPFGDNVSEATKDSINDTVEKKMNELDSNASEIISGCRMQFDEIVRALLDRKVLTHDELIAIVDSQEAA